MSFRLVLRGGPLFGPTGDPLPGKTSGEYNGETHSLGAAGYKTSTTLEQTAGRNILKSTHFSCHWAPGEDYFKPSSALNAPVSVLLIASLFILGCSKTSK